MTYKINAKYDVIICGAFICQASNSAPLSHHFFHLVPLKDISITVSRRKEFCLCSRACVWRWLAFSTFTHRGCLQVFESLLSLSIDLLSLPNLPHYNPPRSFSTGHQSALRPAHGCDASLSVISCHAPGTCWQPISMRRLSGGKSCLIQPNDRKGLRAVIFEIGSGNRFTGT